jgi:hypothetical protein
MGDLKLMVRQQERALAAAQPRPPNVSTTGAADNGKSRLLRCGKDRPPPRSGVQQRICVIRQV